MRTTTMIRLALLGSLATLPALAQSPAPRATPPAVVPPATAPDRPAAVTPRPDTSAGATTPNRESTSQSAVQLGDGVRIGQLEAGANSFTEGQARSRMEAAGFTNLDNLHKDDNGIWRGRGMHAGQQVEVGLDFRGTVSPVTR